MMLSDSMKSISIDHPQPTNTKVVATQQIGMTNIRIPGKNDVIFGRGGGSIHNDANIRYRKLVKAHQKQYISYDTRHMKTLLTYELVKKWRQQSPPGRFIKKNNKTGLWYDVGTSDARRKTAQLFREGAKDIRQEIKNAKESDSEDGSSVTTLEEAFLTPMNRKVTESVFRPNVTAAKASLEQSCAPESEPRSDDALLADLKNIAKAGKCSIAFPYNKPKTSIEMVETFFEDILDDADYSAMDPNSNWAEV